MSGPEVSVLMSVCNGEPYLKEAVDSILRQTFPDFQFIIVDDASEDGTWGILRAYAEQDSRIVLIRNNKNIGLTRSLNKGLKMARGKYMARQDADDVSLPERLATQIAFLERHPSVALLGTAIEWIRDSGTPMGRICLHPCTDAAIRWKMLLQNAFWHTSVMMRRHMIVDKGLHYNGDLMYAQDYDFWSRILMHGQGANLPEPLVQMRSHDKQISQVAWEAQQATADEIALANFKRAGLIEQFSAIDIPVIRRLLDPLSPSQRYLQVRNLISFFELMAQQPGIADSQWRTQKRSTFRTLRKQVPFFPASTPLLRARMAMAWTDPVGEIIDKGQALLDFAQRVKRRLFFLMASNDRK